MPFVALMFKCTPVQQNFDHLVYNLDDFLRIGMKRKDPFKHGTSFERIVFVIESYFADVDIKSSWYFLTKFGTSGHSDYCDEYKIRRDWLEYLRTT